MTHGFPAGAAPVSVFRRYSKAFAALAGALTPGVVIAILAIVGWHVDETLAAGICTVLATVLTLFAPANKEPLDRTEAGIPLDEQRPE